MDDDELVAIATSYFRDLFATSNPDLMDEPLANVSTTISNRLNADITSPVSEQEVKLALFAMYSENALGSDSLTTLFYKFFLEIVKDDLARMVNEFIFEEIIAHRLNDKNICLIPKRINLMKCPNFAQSTYAM